MFSRGSLSSRFLYALEVPPEICVSSRKSYYLTLIKDGDPIGNQLTISFEELLSN